MSPKPPASVPLFQSSLFRAAVLVTLAVSLLIAAMGWLNLRSTTDLAMAQLRKQATGSTEIVVHELAEPMRTANKAQMSRILKDLVDAATNPSEAAMVVDVSGAVAASYAKPGTDTASFRRLAEEVLTSGAEVRADNGLLLAHPILSAAEGKMLGVFVTHWSDEQTLAAISASHRNALIVSGSLLILTLLATTFAFRSTISARLGRITQAMSAIAKGALDTEVPYTGKKDEIGHIAQSLEAFRLSLREAELLNQVALMRGAALASASTAIMLTNTEHEITWVNEAMVRLMRQHASSIQLRNPDFDPENMVGYRADRILENGARVAHDMDGGLITSLRVEQDMPSGILVAEANPVMTVSGEKIGHVAEWHDITASRKNAAIIGAIDATQLRVEFQPDGRVSAANLAMCLLLQLDESELIGRDFSQAMRVDSSGELAFDAIRRGETVIGRIVLSLPGQDVLLNGAMSPVRNREGDIQRVIAIGADMSDIEAREREGRLHRERTAAEQRKVVDELRSALRHLAQGDLTQSIRDPFPADYETLRLDYNDATAKLRGAMENVLENSNLIRAESSGISRAAEDLSRRTEQQAATLEETAAALNELTASVKSASDRTLKANDMVAVAQRNTESSGQVVREAVHAMGEIAESSNKISRITSVIEEISFQTNLLALNAGVEAARAGEAGRGFAVVASEVRALAQRSSEAAREIAGLISDSAGQVKRGVELVGQAGTALEGIQTSVSEIVTFMTDITVSTTEQSAGLSEVNTAMLQLDQVTQHNAAMFEETSAASQSLAREADGLNETLVRFRLGPQDAQRHAAPAAPPKPQASRNVPTVQKATGDLTPKATSVASPPSPTASAMVRSGRATALAVKPAPVEDDWEDF